MRDLKIQVIYEGVSFGAGRSLLSVHRKNYTVKDLVQGIPTDDMFIVAIRQSTGMYDMDGVEIYEGDILKVIIDHEDFGDVHVVEYNPVCGGYIIDVDACDYDMTTLPWAKEMHYYEYKVIGNKWEHKHLLGEQP